jgi:hypothetical protein
VKAIEVLHTSFAVYAAVTAVALAVVAGLVVTSPGVSRHMPRLGRCALLGALAGLALVDYADTKRHVQLAAEAAKPMPHGGHLAVSSLLADGFAGTFLIVTVAAFTVATLAARRRRRAPASWQAPGRPRAGAGTWRS